MGSEHDVGYPHIDHVDAQSDGNVSDGGVSDTFSYTSKFVKESQLAGGNTKISHIGNQYEHMNVRHKSPRPEDTTVESCIE